MAKTKDNNSSATDDIFQQLISQHNALAPKAATLGTDMSSRVEMWIPTGSIILDTVISNKDEGGWPCGRIIELYGEEAYGKSTMAFQAAANCQKMGGYAIYFDVENAAAEELMKACSIDFNKLLYSNLETIEEIFEALEKNLTTIANDNRFKGKPVFVCIDSLAAMKTRQLMEGTYDYNMNTQSMFAKLMGSALKRIVPFLNKANAALMIINQMRDKIGGNPHSDPKTTPGGNALKFYASVRIRLLGKKAIEVIEEVTQEKIPIGYDVIARTDKNKVGPPKRKAEFTIIFAKGIQEESSWLDYCVNSGLVTRGGAWYTFSESIGEKSLVGTKFQSKDWGGYMNDKNIHDVIKRKLVEKFIRPMEMLTTPQNTEEIEDVEEFLSDNQNVA